jgi:hypothetical protein
LILERKKIDNPRVDWYLLDIIRAERRYRMLEVALKLVVQVEKVGKLLGRNFEITKHGLEQAVDSVIADDVKRYGLNLRKLNTDLVDWNALIDRAASRHPPFEAGGKTEKGFRDAVALETFAQLVEDISKSKGDQRIVLITKDGRLREAVEERMQGIDKVSVVDDIETMRSMLNAYAAEIGAHALEAILEKAQLLFYGNNDSESLFYKWKIEQGIRAKYGSFSEETPAPKWTPGFVSVVLVSVGPTTFVEKKQQQVTFATYLDFRVMITSFNFWDTPNSSPALGGPVPSFREYSPEPFRSSTALYPSGGITRGDDTRNVTTGTGLLPYSSGLPWVGFGTGSIEPSSSYPAGTRAPPPEVSRRERGVRIEVKWRAIVTDNGELRDCELIEFGPYSVQWSRDW